MEYGKLLDSLPNILKMKYRKYENLVKKYINAEWSKLFNSICVKENLWPTYTNRIFAIFLAKSFGMKFRQFKRNSYICLRLNED